MEIVYIKTSEIEPYGNNSKKHTRSQIEKIKKSIKQFGLNSPIAVHGESNTIVYGHGRFEALKQLGYEEIPCVRLDHLSDDERRAYTIADNKLHDMTGYNKKLINFEVFSLPAFNMKNFGVNTKKIFDDKNYSGDEREKTLDYYRMRDFDEYRTAGKYQMPIICRENHIPKEMISFNYMLTSEEYEKGIHFFIDDYQFERIWKNPDKYIERLKKFDCVLTPDFSLYTDMALPIQIYNIYRSRLIGQIMQDNGIKVIPTLSWCLENSFDFCFDGIEKHGTVAVSTIGVKRDKSALEIWKKGMEKAIEVTEPKNILLYGGKIDFNFGKINVAYFSNENTQRLKGVNLK